RHPTEAYGCELAASAAGTLGQAERAVSFLRAAEAIDSRHPVSWRLSPHLAAVQDRPGFEAFMGERAPRLVWPAEAAVLTSEERLRFPDYSEASGLEEDTHSAAAGG